MTPGIAEPHPSKLTGFPAWIVLILIPEMLKKNPDELSDNLSLPDNHDRETPVKPIFIEKPNLLAILYKTEKYLIDNIWLRYLWHRGDAFMFYKSQQSVNNKHNTNVFGSLFWMDILIPEGLNLSKVISNV